MSDIAFCFKPDWFLNMTQAWQDGYIAYFAGRLIIDNPCSPGSMEREDWFDGWKTAESR